MIYICYIICRDNVATCVLVVRDDELSVKDDTTRRRRLPREGHMQEGTGKVTRMDLESKGHETGHVRNRTLNFKAGIAGIPGSRARRRGPSDGAGDSRLSEARHVASVTVSIRWIGTPKKAIRGRKWQPDLSDQARNGKQICQKLTK
jgi:hypothetical protein